MDGASGHLTVHVCLIYSDIALKAGLETDITLFGKSGAVDLAALRVRRVFVLDITNLEHTQ